MKIGYIVNHPTQFEVPFYQYVFRNAPGKLVVYYLEEKGAHYDKELQIRVGWGFNLYEGYTFHFLKDYTQLDLSIDVFILNGYKGKYTSVLNFFRRNAVPAALKLDSVLFNQSNLKIILRKLFLKNSYNKFRHFFITGNASRQYLHKMGIPDSRINIFSYCIDNDFFSSGAIDERRKSALKEELGLSGTKVILSVAKFAERESPWDILRAFIQLNSSDYSLVLIGDGKERPALEGLAQQNPYLKIYFRGYVPYQELPVYYGISDVFVHGAQNEPWGVSVQEALAGGCKIIASDRVGAAIDMVKEGRNGFIYSYGNYKELAAKIKDIFAVKEEISNEATDEVLSFWNYQTMWKEIQTGAASMGKCVV